MLSLKVLTTSSAKEKCLVSHFCVCVMHTNKDKTLEAQTLTDGPTLSEPLNP